MGTFAINNSALLRCSNANGCHNATEFHPALIIHGKSHIFTCGSSAQRVAESCFLMHRFSWCSAKADNTLLQDVSIILHGAGLRGSHLAQVLALNLIVSYNGLFVQARIPLNARNKWMWMYSYAHLTTTNVLHMNLIGHTEGHVTKFSGSKLIIFVLKHMWAQGKRHNSFIYVWYVKVTNFSWYELILFYTIWCISERAGVMCIWGCITEWVSIFLKAGGQEVQSIIVGGIKNCL